jgi:hypothetical protein
MQVSTDTILIKQLKTVALVMKCLRSQHSNSQSDKAAISAGHMHSHDSVRFAFSLQTLALEMSVNKIICAGQKVLLSECSRLRKCNVDTLQA